MPGLLNAAQLDQGRTTFWVLPLLSMHEQYHTRSKQHAISCESWTKDTAVPPTNLLITIEQTMSGMFHRYAASLAATSRISRVIVDEAHLLLTHESFRPVMGTLQWLGQQGVQVVLQTATLPPTLEPDLFAALGITSYRICRSKTSRSNISYNVIRCPRADLQTTLEKQFRQAMAYATDNRILIFCLSRVEAEQTAQLLRIPSCHAGMSEEETGELLTQFRSGAVRAIACTSILGVALDVPQVAHVIHLDYPRDILAFIQEAGRAGRDRHLSKAWSIVIAPLGVTHKRIDKDRFGVQLLIDALNDDQLCRRLVLQYFLDGVAESCTMMEGTTHMCDVCERISTTAPDRNNSSAFPPFMQTNSSTPTRTHLNPPPQTPSSLQMATFHSQLVHKPKQTSLPKSAEIRRIKRALDILTSSCVACWLLGKKPEHDHLLKDCTNCGDNDKSHSSLVFPKGFCYRCGCPQHVRDNNYIPFLISS
jgi:superfamily II DNA helicase RecQ